MASRAACDRLAVNRVVFEHVARHDRKLQRCSEATRAIVEIALIRSTVKRGWASSERKWRRIPSCQSDVCTKRTTRNAFSFLSTPA